MQIENDDFSYRIGQRIDFGFEFDRYTAYSTIGFGIMRNNHKRQTSPVYGFGFLTEINKKILWVNEINFQDVRSGDAHYKIANLSTGLTFLF